MTADLTPCNYGTAPPADAGYAPTDCPLDCEHDLEERCEREWCVTCDNWCPCEACECPEPHHNEGGGESMSGRVGP